MNNDERKELLRLLNNRMAAAQRFRELMFVRYLASDVGKCLIIVYLSFWQSWEMGLMGFLILIMGKWDLATHRKEIAQGPEFQTVIDVCNKLFSWLEKNPPNKNPR